MDSDNRHSDYVDKLTERLLSKGRDPVKYVLYGVGGRAFGEFDVMTIEHRGGYSHVTMYEVKTGSSDNSLRTALYQARNFYRFYSLNTYTVPRFVYVHADGTAKYWRKKEVFNGKKFC